MTMQQQLKIAIIEQTKRNLNLHKKSTQEFTKEEQELFDIKHEELQNLVRQHVRYERISAAPTLNPYQINLLKEKYPNFKSSPYYAYQQSEEWKLLYLKVSLRDKGRCQQCGRPGLMVHHKTYETLLTEKESDDCIFLCRYCHFHTHFDVNSILCGSCGRTKQRLYINWYGWVLCDSCFIPPPPEITIEEVSPNAKSLPWTRIHY